jgi:putative tryptophan/tyrosine transport system substrate-binding protein
VANIEEYARASRELVARKVDIFVASGSEVALRSALAVTDTLPIIMTAIDYDPFARGYVTNLARPTGNVTGVFFQQVELVTKRLQFVTDAFHDLRAATVFWDESSADQWRTAESVSSEASCTTSPTITNKQSQRRRLIIAAGCS